MLLTMQITCTFFNGMTAIMVGVQLQQLHQGDCGVTLVFMQGCTIVFHTASPFVLSAGYGAAVHTGLLPRAHTHVP
jgi:hypothetical protein